MIQVRRCGSAVLTVLFIVATAPAIEPGDLPGDTEAVLVVNLRQALAAEIVKQHKELLDHLKFMADNELTNVGAQRYLEKMEFEPLRDLDRLTVSFAGSKTPDFILLEGKFQPDKFAAAGAEASKDHPDHLKEVKIAGRPAFEIHPEGGDAVYAGLLGKNRMIAASSKDRFEQAVARVGSGKKGNIRQELRQAIEEGGDKRSLVFVTTGPALARLVEDAPVPNIEALQGLLQSVSALTVAVTLEKNINFELAVNSKDKQSAEQMAKLAGVGLAAGRMMLKKKAEADPKLAAALDVLATMRVSTKDNTFVLRGELTPAALDKLLKAVPNR